MLSPETHEELRRFAAAGRLGAVPAPPVRLTISAADQTGFAGEEVAFSWRAENAREVRLEAPGRGEVREVPAAGTLVVTVGHEEECFRLVAYGAEDRATKDLLVQARRLDLYSAPPELDLLTLSWELPL